MHMTPGIFGWKWVHLLCFPSLTAKLSITAKNSDVAKAGEEKRRIMLKGIYKPIKILFSHQYKSISKMSENNRN